MGKNKKISIEDLIEYVRPHSGSNPILKEASKNKSFGLLDLELQTLLHLPRLVTDQMPTEETLTQEVASLANKLEQKVSPYNSLSIAPRDKVNNLTGTHFSQIDNEKAKIIHENFHYISSFRKDGLHFGLHIGNKIASLVTLSPFDLRNIAKELPENISPNEVGVLSRIYSFQWAPRNSISHLLGKLNSHLRKTQPKIKMLLTYVNRNLGFTGSSYKAANWMQFGQEVNTYYAYVDGKYQTDRDLTNRFGTFDKTKLSTQLCDRFQTNKINLRPLVLFAHFIDNNIQKKYSTGFKHTFTRPQTHDDYS